MATNEFSDPHSAAAEGADAAPHPGANEPSPTEATLPAAGEDLAIELEKAKAEGAAHYESFLRAKADAENARRRSLEDVAKARKFGTESFAESLLPVMDSLEAALSNPSADADKLREGVELTLRQLQTAFERNQLTAIDPVGQRFDPHKHQAISTQAMPGVEANHVGQVLQKGWSIADRVLRPALVTVGQ